LQKAVRSRSLQRLSQRGIIEEIAMAKTEQDTTAGRQKEGSRQSAQQGDPKPQSGRPPGAQQSPSGIGSSQGQDRGSPPDRPQGRPSAGTPDIERGGPQDVERGGESRESLVQDPTGAFKERP